MEKLQITIVFFFFSIFLVHFLTSGYYYIVMFFTPTRLEEQERGASNTRLDALKRQKDNATQALKAEKARQKIQNAQQQITTARQSMLTKT